MKRSIYFIFLRVMGSKRKVSQKLLGLRRHYFLHRQAKVRNPPMNFLTDIFSECHQPHDGRLINTETIASVVFLNESDAARVFGMGTTRFKVNCRRIGITFWPHRRLTALKNLYNALKKDELDHTAGMNEIESFVRMIKKDLSLATAPWPKNILSIRRKIYKKRHKQIVSDRVTIEADKKKGMEGDEDIRDVCLDDYLLHHDYTLTYDLFSQL